MKTRMLAILTLVAILAVTQGCATIAGELLNEMWDFDDEPHRTRRPYGQGDMSQPVMREPNWGQPPKPSNRSARRTTPPPRPAPKPAPKPDDPHCDALVDEAFALYKQFDYGQVLARTHEVLDNSRASKRQRMQALILRGAAATILGQGEQALRAFRTLKRLDPDVSPNRDLFPATVLRRYEQAQP